MKRADRKQKTSKGEERNEGMKARQEDTRQEESGQRTGERKRTENMRYK